MIFLQNNIHTKTIFLQPSTVVVCANCQTDMPIALAEKLACEGNQIPDFTDFMEAIEIAMEADGWQQGYCSCCIATTPGILTRDRDYDEEGHE